MKFEELQESVLSWAEDRNLLHPENSDKQFLKFVEEIFEFKTEMDVITRYRKYYRENPHKKIPKAEHNRITKKTMMEMGDIFVTLVILCKQLEMDPMECLELAYEKIKDRSGKTINGTFVKQEDLED